MKYEIIFVDHIWDERSSGLQLHLSRSDSINWRWLRGKLPWVLWNHRRHFYSHDPVYLISTQHERKKEKKNNIILIGLGEDVGWAILSKPFVGFRIYSYTEHRQRVWSVDCWRLRQNSAQSAYLYTWIVSISRITRTQQSALHVQHEQTNTLCVVLCFVHVDTALNRILCRNARRDADRVTRGRQYCRRCLAAADRPSLIFCYAAICNSSGPYRLHSSPFSTNTHRRVGDLGLARSTQQQNTVHSKLWASLAISRSFINSSLFVIYSDNLIAENCVCVSVCVCAAHASTH